MEVPHRITSYFNPLILVDSMASFAIAVICFWGISAMMLFSHWKKRSEYVDQSEYEYFNSEVNRLKGQITPNFLSKVLNNASALVAKNPAKASEILMQLGQLLRYQLYDCKRDKVLLSSEINFITNFLNLERLINERFDYEIQVEGSVNNKFISPLLLISVTQAIINTDEPASINLNFKVAGNRLEFKCSSDKINIQTDNDISAIRESLDLLYTGEYTLTVSQATIVLKLNKLD